MLDGLLGSILNSFAEGVVVTNPHGALVLHNTAAEWMRKACFQGVRGEVFLADGVTHVPADQLPINRALRGETVDDIELLLREDGGAERWVHITAKPLAAEDGGQLGAVAVCRDVTRRKRAESALAESERRYRAIFNAAFESVAVFECDGTLIEANQTALDLIGAKPAGVYGRKFWETAGWSDAPEVAHLIRDAVQAAAAGRATRREVDYTTPQGGRLRFDFSMKPICDEDGRPVLLLAEGHDISERAEMAMRARESQSVIEAQKRYQTLLESAPDAILEVDSRGLIVTANAMAAKMFGYRSEELLGQNVDVLVPGGLRGHHSSHRSSYMSNPQTRPMGGGLELHVQRKDGSLMPAEISLSPVRQPDGFNVTAIIRDITERKQAADAVKASAEQFETLFRTAPAPEWALDAETQRFLAVNDAATEAFGYSREEFLAMTIEGIQAGGEQPANGIVRYRRKDGSVIAAEVTGHGVVYRGRNARLVIARDVTERERAAQLLVQAKRDAETASKAKSDFLASMSHELRSPLHTIIGFAELLGEELDGPLNAKQKRFIHNIHQDSKHLLEIINDVLDISKIEAGRMEIRSEWFSMQGAVDEALASIQGQASSKRIAVTARLPAADLRADRLRFKQILYNLLSNAVKFTPEGGAISLSALARKDKVAISLTDTGIGIANAEQEAIFDKFYQAASTTRGVREGTGLGLAITRQLVEQQCGRIWVDSELGRGSRFTFTIPGKAEPAERKPLVLVAGSETEANELLVNYLEPNGYGTAAALGVARAIMLAEELQPEAIVLDLLAQSEGWEALLGWKASPVIVVSVADGDALPRSIGVPVHLTKPVGKRALIETLRRLTTPRMAAGETVLVVEDEASARDLVCEILREGKFDPVTAASGDEALAALGRMHPRAIVLDLAMPGMSGIELLMRIKRNPQWAGVPVIVLTGMQIGAEDARVVRQEARALFLKGGNWREELIGELGRIVSSSA